MGFESSKIDLALNLSHSVGMQLAVRGYSHKQAILLEKILQRIAGLTISIERFEVLKEKVRIPTFFLYSN